MTAVPAPIPRAWLYALSYLATPYTRYSAGLEGAYVDACALAGKLLAIGVRCYSPIAQTHGIAKHGGLDPLDHEIWMPFDSAMMSKSDALIVAHLPGWDASRGIAEEIDVFAAAGKPIFDLDPDNLFITRRK